MKIVGIVAEYNPFHNGHLYQLQEIRRAFGEDTAIIAVMSGNYTQRAEPAFFDKVQRAACAVRSGVDLVLELPFPYSAAPAEIFARSAVSILHALGCVDILSFGSECGDVHTLCTVSERLCSEDFARVRREAIASHPERGHARITEETYNELYADSIPFAPNNILAFEYLAALRLLDSTIVPHTVHRIGADYAKTELSAAFSGAGAIRRAIREGNDDALTQLPANVAQTITELRAHGHIDADMNRLYPAVAAKLMGCESGTDIPDANDGLYFRLRAAALQATDISSIIERTQTKRYTHSRIRRVILSTLFGVTSSDLAMLPHYTQLLGATAVGLSILKRIKARATVCILTKPSDEDKLPADARRQKALADLADRLYGLTLPHPTEPYRALAYTPYIHK